MKKINFSSDVLPHLIAVAVFFLVTVFFFNPYFFDNKSLNQGDIHQAVGAAQALHDYRDQTGNEGLWAPNMFSGMPGYLVNVEWGYQPVAAIQSILSLGISHPVRNIFLGVLSYYILLLAFRVRPYLAIAGALAFGYSSYIIVGLSAGHNARIGAIAFMPLVMAGIHLVFSGRRKIGFAATAAGLAMQLRSNHLQMTYYLLLIVVGYGIVQMMSSLKEKRLSGFGKNLLILTPAALLGLGTFFGPLWAINEYTKYSIRGPSEIASTSTAKAGGLPESYAFEFSNGILEPMTLLIPDFYGGASSDFLVQDPDSHTYRALSESGNQKMINQLAGSTSAYWGPQRMSAPYYGGAIICFLFVIGILFAEKKYVWWLVSISALAIMMSWGDHFQAFNYFLFNHLPVYNKFRSPAFTIIIVLFAMPLLGLLGLENIFKNGLDKTRKKKVLTAFVIAGGLCLFFILFAGTLGFNSSDEAQLPSWFTSALRADRKALLIKDALRSLGFIAVVFVMIYFELYKRLAPTVIYFVLGLLVIIDIAAVDKRYFTPDNYQRRRPEAAFTATAADQQIMKDKSYYRVLNLGVDPWNDATTSYFHNSIGGYHGAKMKRYQDLYDSCLHQQIGAFIRTAQAGKIDFSVAGTLNMLNVKYILYGPDRDNIIINDLAGGPAWFTQSVETVSSPLADLQKICEVDPTAVAVINESDFKLPNLSYDSTATIQLLEHRPNYLKYESNATTTNLAVFSEIYYPKGWYASIDGKQTDILCTDYVLRALVIPSGKHAIEFSFEPRAYAVGNKITTASSWLLVVVVIGMLGWAIKKDG